MKMKTLSWAEVQALAHGIIDGSLWLVRWYAAAESTLTPLGPVSENVPEEYMPAELQRSLEEETSGPAGYTDLYRVTFWNTTHLLAALVAVVSSESRSAAIGSSATHVPYLHLVSWAVAQERVLEAIARAREQDDPKEVLADLYAETQRDFTAQLISEIETTNRPHPRPKNRILNF